MRVYLCGQTLFKIHPDFDAVVGDILRADADGQVRFLVGPVPAWVDSLKSRFRQTLPDVHDRIDFVAAPTTVEYLGLHCAADVVLDTFHFGGGISALDTLEVGAPMVTWPGRFFRSRQARACYVEMEMDDCIATDRARYAQLAVSIANDADRQAEIRAKIRSRNHRLFRRSEAVRELERFLVQAVEARCCADS
jgi:predicted O-linked N-acetylglucosamine transferase (SPINDLY family)